MIGLNLTHQALATREMFERIRAVPGEPARAVAGWMAFFGERYERVHGIFAPPVHDPCTVALLVDPSLMRASTRSSRSRLQGRWTRGATVVDLSGRLGQATQRARRAGPRRAAVLGLVIGALERLG